MLPEFYKKPGALQATDPWFALEEIAASINVSGNEW
jgi:hypothetical protein